jgi:hypothetical protein
MMSGGSRHWSTRNDIAKWVTPQNLYSTHGVSTVAWVPEPKGRWAFPVLRERITSQETPFGLPFAWQGRGG